MLFLKWRKHFIKSIVIFILVFLVYFEWIIYFVQYVSWPSVKCGDTKHVTRVLFVADPQILGERTEHWIARWDSDRFLKQTFALAVKHVDPSVIVFLGDLMDEGSIATTDQYERYYSRFRKIFRIDRFPANRTIFLPGDNDIGGEDEDITSFKVNRYFKHFNQPEYSEMENALFIKVNKLLTTFPEIKVSNAEINIRVALSHIPLLGVPNAFASKAIVAVHPHIIFSAHDHKSIHFVGDPYTGDRSLIEQLITNNYYEASPPSWRFQINKDLINEITVPTCSYRMGVVDIGYGMALIDKKGEAVCYSILWLPRRLYHLLLYLFVLIPSVLLVSILVIIKMFCRRWNRQLLLV